MGARASTAVVVTTLYMAACGELLTASAPPADTPDAALPDAPYADDGAAADAPPGCGANGRGAIGADGGCVEPLVDGQSDPFDVVVAGSRLIWSSFGDAGGGSIHSSDLAGGDVRLVVAEARHPKFLHVSNAKLYWGDQTALHEDGNVAGRFHERLLDGTTATRALFDHFSIRGVVASSTHAYAVTWGGTLYEDNLANGAERIMQNALVDPNGLDRDAVGLVVAIGGSDTYPGAVLSKLVTTGPGEDHWVKTRGVATYPYGVRADGTYVFWTQRNALDGAAGAQGAVYRVDRATGNNEAALCSALALPQLLALDAANVYFTNRGLGDRDGTVVRVGKTSGQCTVLAAGLARPHGIAVTNDHVYVTTRGDGRLWRFPKNP